MKKQTLVDRVLSVLQGGDKAKISRFETKLTKYFSKQISMRRDKIENLQEKIDDAKETLNEAVLNVDLDAINGADGAEGYCSVYVSNLDNKLKVIESLETEIEDLQEEIERFEKIQASVYSADEK